MALKTPAALAQYGIDNTGPSTIFDPVSTTSASGQKPKQLTPNQIEKRNAELREQQLTRESDFIIEGLTNNPLWTEGSTVQRREIIDNWKKTQWQPYAASRFGANLEEATRFQSRILARLEPVLAEQIRSTQGIGTSVDNLASSVGRGADQAYDAIVAGTPFVSDAVQQNVYTQRLEELQAEREAIINDAYASDREKERLVARTDNLISQTKRDLEINTSELLDSQATFSQEVSKSAANEQARQRGNALRRDRTVRQQELRERGSETPALDALTEASFPNMVGQALNIIFEQTPNIAATAIPALVTSTLAGPVAGGSAVVASGAFLTATQNASEVAQDILNLTQEQLAMLPQYMAHVESGLTLEEAKNKLAQDAVVEVLGISAALGAASGLLGPEAMIARSSVLAPLLQGGLVRRAAIGAALSATEEGITEALEQVNINRAYNEATGDSRPLTEDVGDAAALGAIAGLGFGGAGGVFSRGAPIENEGPGTTNTVPDSPVGPVPTEINLETNTLIQDTQAATDNLLAATTSLDSFVEARTYPTPQEQQTIFENLYQAEQNGLTHEQALQVLENFNSVATLPSNLENNVLTGYEEFVAVQTLDTTENIDNGTIRQVTAGQATRVDEGTPAAFAGLSDPTRVLDTAIFSTNASENLRVNTAVEGPGISGTTQQSVAEVPGTTDTYQSMGRAAGIGTYGGPNYSGVSESVSTANPSQRIFAGTPNRSSGDIAVGENIGEFEEPVRAINPQQFPKVAQAYTQGVTTGPADVAKVSTLATNNSLEIAEAAQVMSRDERMGDRVLGRLNQPQGIGSAVIEQALRALPNEVWIIIEQAWSTFAAQTAPNTMEDVAYLNRNFDAVVADAIADANREVGVDPFYTTQSPAIREAIQAVRDQVQSRAFIVAENQLTPITMPSAGDVTSNGRGLFYAVTRWLQMQGLIPNGKKAIIVDRASGRAFVVQTRGNRLGAIFTAVGYVPTHAYGDGAAFGGARTTKTILRGQDNVYRVLESAQITPDTFNFRAVRRVDNRAQTDSFFTSAGYFNGLLRRDFTGKIFYLSPRLDVAAHTERNLLDNNNTNVVPEAVMDGQTAVIDGTVAQAAAGNQQAQAVISSLTDPHFDKQGFQETSNPDKDMAAWMQLQNYAIAAGQEAPYVVASDVGLDGIELSPYAAGLTQAPPVESTLTPVQEREVQETLGAEINAAITEDNEPLGPGAEPNPPIDGQEELAEQMRDVFNQQFSQLAQARQEAARTASDVSPTRFAPVEYAQPLQQSRWRSIGTSIRKAFLDTASPFLEWVTRVEPTRSGEYDDHPLWKSFKLMIAQTRAAKSRLYNTYMQTFDNICYRIAEDMGFEGPAVWEDLGTYATAYHIITEGSAAHRQSLVDVLQTALSQPASRDKNAAVQAAQRELDAYDAYQANPFEAEKVPVAGGLTDIEAMQKIQALRDKGYSDYNLEQGRLALVQAYEGVTLERLRSGTLSETEVANWQPFVSYVPLTVDTEGNMSAANDVDSVIRNPSRDHVRQGSLRQSENAADAMSRMVSRVAAEISTQPFLEELNATYTRLAENGNTYGLQRWSLAEIHSMLSSPKYAETGRTRNDLNGFIYRMPQTLPDGTETRVTYKFTFFDSANRDTTDALVRAISTPVANQSKLAEVSTSLTRGVGRLFTKWRVSFAPKNAMQDIIERTVNTTARDFRAADGTPISGAQLAPRMLAYAANPKLMHQFAKAFSGNDANSYYGRYWTEFQNSGAYFTFNQLLEGKSSQLTGDHLANMNYIRRTLKAPSKVLDAYNDAFNSVPSFIQYVTMREAGMTVNDAAFWTLDMLNLYDTGSLTPMLSTVFPFVRPIFQSGGNLLRTLGLHVGVAQSPRAAFRGWATLTGLTAGFSMLLPFIKGNAGDDPETGVNRFDAMSLNQMQTSVPLFTADGDFWRMPVGFGLSQTAWSAAVCFDRVSRGIMSPGEGFFHTFLTATKNIAPDTYPDYAFADDPAKWLLQTFSPSTLRPIVDLGANKNNWGQPIYQGNPPIGKRKAESGYRATADVWQEAAKGIQQYTGLDMAPEQWRYFFNGYLMGPLQGIMAFLEEDSLYKSPIHQSTRDNLGPWGSALGASAIYNTEMNVSAQLYYSRKSDMERELTKRGVRVTDSANRGDTERSENFIREQMAIGGFNQPQIDDYITLTRYRKKLDKLDRNFRERLDSLRTQEAPAEEIQREFYEWSSQKHAFQTQAVRSLNYFKAPYHWTGSGGPAFAVQPATEGNIDSATRPMVQNSDGTVSTSLTIGVNIDGDEVVIPTIADDGRILTTEEAVAQYYRTGKHFGKFDNVEEATQFAQQLSSGLGNISGDSK